MGMRPSLGHLIAMTKPPLKMMPCSGVSELTRATSLAGRRRLVSCMLQITPSLECD